MVAVTTFGGVLRVQAELEIPSAPGGSWDEVRVAKLVSLIREMVEAAELVDSAELEIIKPKIGLFFGETEVEFL